MAEQVPSVGRVVHYVAYGTPGGEHPAGAHRAAIITEVYDAKNQGWAASASDEIDMTIAGLCILNPAGMFFNRHTPFDASGKQPGSWHWPEYVPAKG